MSMGSTGTAHAGPVSPARGKDLLTALALALASSGAWVALLSLGGSDMDVGGVGDALAFVGSWLLMMTAMMLPSAVPFVLLLRRTAHRHPAEAAGLAAIGYLGVWAATGIVALTVNALLDPTPTAVALVLVAAGAYQLTPLKTWCLRRCRSPFGFLMQHWRDDRRRAPLRLGALHGAHCVGCCWALMLVLVGAVGMGFGWVALVAAVILVEKVLPGGERLTRPLGLGLIAAGIALLLDPGLAGLGESGMTMRMETM